MAFHTYSLQPGQRSRPLAFAGSSVLRSNPLKNRLLLVLSGAQGMAPANLSVGYRESKNYNKIARMLFSRIGRLWQHQALENHSRSPQCGLTPRSRRGPTSKRQARAAGGAHFPPREPGVLLLAPPQLER